MNGTHLTLGLVGFAALAGASRRGSRSRRPVYGDVVKADDYGPFGSVLYQPVLFHVTNRENLSSILRHGLTRGNACNYAEAGIVERCRDKVFFSLQPSRWAHDHRDPVLLGVPTCWARCVYDGEEWLYDDVEEEDEERYGRMIVPGRLSDCYTTSNIPPEHIRVMDWATELQRYEPWHARSWLAR
jgi:hypothetical protein